MKPLSRSKIGTAVDVWSLFYAERSENEAKAAVGCPRSDGSELKSKMRNRVATWVLSAILVVVLMGICGSVYFGHFHPRLVSPKEVPVDNVAMSQSRYIGSDSRYHFFRNIGESFFTTYYKVRREELIIPGEFPYGQSDVIWIPKEMNAQFIELDE